MEKEYPRLAGLMIGRGLLARPTLAKEYAEGKEMSLSARMSVLMQMHERLKNHYETTVNSEAQLQNKLRLFWEYMETELGKKSYKKIMKAGNLKNYLAAVSVLRSL